MVEDVLVLLDGGRVAFAGPAQERHRADGGAPERTASEPEDEILFDGFLMPGVVDRHVHIGLADPGEIGRAHV